MGCHNTPEILKGIRNYKGDIFKLMVKIAPEIISDKIGVLEIKEIKEALAIEKDLEIKKDLEERQLALKIKQDKEALAIEKALEIKNIEERRRKLALIIKEEKEAITIEKDKKASEESIRKAEEEAIER